MQVLSLADALQTEDGQTLMCVTGVIDAIFELSSGVNDKGPWQIQNLMLKDNGSKMKLKLMDVEPIPGTAKGKRIWLSCTKSSKGWNGVKVKEDSYNGKTSKILSCTKTVAVSFVDPSTGVEAPPVEAPQTAAPRAKGPPAQAGFATQRAPARPAPAPEAEYETQPPPEYDEAPPSRTTAPAPAPAPAHVNGNGHQDKVTAARHALGAARNAYKLCIMAGRRTAEEYEQDYGEAMSEEQFKSMINSLFIWMDRNGVIDGLPPGDLTPYLPKARA